MILFKEVGLMRTKQVQFRMDPNVHKLLKMTLIANNSSIADFFNAAAEDYLKSNSDIFNEINKTKNCEDKDNE